MRKTHDRVDTEANGARKRPNAAAVKGELVDELLAFVVLDAIRTIGDGLRCGVLQLVP